MRDPWDWDEQAKQEAEARVRALRLNARFQEGHSDPGIVGDEDYPPEWGIWRRTREEGGEA